MTPAERGGLRRHKEIPAVLEPGTRSSAMLRTLVFVLVTSAPASAAVAPQAEGIGLYAASLPILLAAIYLLCPRFTVARAGMVMLLTLPGFLMVGFIAWGFFFLPCLAILQGVENHKRVRMTRRHAAHPERHRVPRTPPVSWSRFGLGVSLLVLCGLCWGLTVWSAAYAVIAQRHENALDCMSRSAENIHDYRKRHREYPTPAEARRLLPVDLPVTYEVSSDRASFRLFYSGNAFTQNPWYTLGPHLPEYRSEAGMTRGERMPLFSALSVRLTHPR